MNRNSPTNTACTHMPWSVFAPSLDGWLLRRRFPESYLLERLLLLGQHVTGLDNFTPGPRRNIDQGLERAAEA